MAAAEMAQCTVEAIPTAMNEGMLISGIILAISFIGIFTETLHGFHRVKVAMLCLLYTSPSPRDRTRSRMPSSA